MAPEIIITISKQGETTVKVNGVAGPGCRDLSSSIEKAIGQEAGIEFTSEYYQEKESGGEQVKQ